MKFKIPSILLLLLLVVTMALGKSISAISIDGLQNEREKTVLSMVPLRVGTEYTLEDIQESIRQLYRSERFKSVKMFTLNETETTTSILISLEENPYLYDFEFHGNKKVKESALKEAVTLKRGQLISDSKVFDNVVAIQKLYHSKGYLQAEITVDMIETSVPGSIIAKFSIIEHDKVRISGVSFTGNESFTTKKLRRKFKTKERHMFNSGEFNEAEYKQHLDSLVLFYNEGGYMDARIISDSVGMNSDSDGLEIKITLDEGPLYVAGEFYFVNNDVVDDVTLYSGIALRTDKPFARSKFMMSQQAVGNIYRNEGYLWSQVTPEYKYRGDTVDVVFTIVEGRPAIVRKIDVTGNDKTREQVIRRELHIYPGQKYSQAAMERSIREVHQLNFFDDVAPDIAPHDDGTIDLIFDVKEKDNIGQFSAGITYSQQDKFGGNFSVSIPNFRGTGEQFDATVEISKERQKYSIGFMEPWIFNRPTSFSSRLFYESLDYGSNTSRSLYNYQRTGLELGLGKRLKWPDDYFSVAARYLISYDNNNTDYNQVEDSLHVNIPSQGILNRLYLALMRDDTDFPQFPTRGSRFTIAGYMGFSFPSSNPDLEPYDFLKGTVSYDWYMPLFWKFALGTKAKFGMISSFGDEPSLGYSDLFKVGGVYYDGVVRGYPDGVALGKFGLPNLTMLTLSAELRFPIIDQQFYMAGFFDAGNSWNTMGEISLTDLYPGVGFGFRLMLPMVGLLGFDFAWGLRSTEGNEFFQDNDPAGFQLHFVMNKGF